MKHENQPRVSFAQRFLAFVSNWWGRPAGGKEVMALALPLVMSTLSYTIMHFCDRMFLSWHSTTALAAVLPAGVLGWTLFSMPMGIAGYANTFVAQYFGSGQHKMIGRILWQATRVGVWSIPMFLVVGICSESLFLWFGHSENLVAQETIYFQIITIGAGAVVIDSALSSYFTGRGRTGIVMVINVLAAILNIGIDPLLIFGTKFSPAFGIEGAAWATTIALWFKVAVYSVLIGFAADAGNNGVFSGRVFDIDLTRRLLKYGTPNGIQFLMEGGAITVFVLLVARIGEISAAATTVAFSINMVAFVPIVGMGIAVTTIVGQRIGQRDTTLAARAVWTGLTIALIYNSVFAFCYVFCPSWFLAGYSIAGEHIQQVEPLARTLLIFVAAYCLFDAVQLIFVSALKGAGDTLYVLLVTLVSAVLFVVGGYWGASQFPSKYSQLMSWWYALTAWIVFLAIAYIARFLQGNWKTMSVIEYKCEEVDQISAPIKLADGELPAEIETMV